MENKKSNYIWNAIAGLLNALEAVLLSMFIVRIMGLEDAGIISIAFASANLFLTLGKYGVRNYQVTNLESSHFFKNYFYLRIITMGAMLLVSIVYCYTGIQHRGYSIYKAGTILFMCLIYCLEALEDVFGGLYQSNGRLDLAAKSFIIRWSGILTVYVVGILLLRDLFMTTVIAFFVSLILLILCIVLFYPQFRTKGEPVSLFSLMKKCLPLCISSFLGFYICNAPKYAIDSCMTDDIQACFGFVAMPVFVISLLSGFVYQPILVEMAIEWNKQQYSRVVRRIFRQIQMILGLTVICVCGANYLGIPVLSWLYHTDLSSYKAELLIMVGGGGMLAITSFLNIILTIMNRMKNIIISYFAVAIVDIMVFSFIANHYGTVGAACVFIASMLTLSILLCSAIFMTLRRIKFARKR